MQASLYDATFRAFELHCEFHETASSQNNMYVGNSAQKHFMVIDVQKSSLVQLVVELAHWF